MTDRSEWKDISTAPKDGTVVDLWAHGRRYPSAQWVHWIEPEFQCWQVQHLYDAEGGHHWDVPHISPTHWRLPPPPPSGKEEER